MNCPECGGDTKVIDSRPSPDGSIRRRRECILCKHRITTYEVTDYQRHDDDIQYNLGYSDCKEAAIALLKKALSNLEKV